MGATLTASAPTAAPPSRRGRARVAALERPLLAAGLGLVTLHLLDLALAGPATSLLGVLAIVAVPLAWWVARPHVTRATRVALAVPVGLLALGFGVASHGLHVVNSGLAAGGRHRRRHGGGRPAALRVGCSPPSRLPGARRAARASGGAPRTAPGG